MITIQIIAIAGSYDVPSISRALQHSDLWIESHQDTPDGRGETKFATSREKALQFNSIGEAFEFWRQISKGVPLRPDGKPNRPLTVFTVEIR